MKMRVHRIELLLSVIVLLSVTVLLLISSCSSDSGGETGTGVTPPTPITVVGPITGFGSIFVNGIEFETDNANIEFDETATTEDDLAVGMIVTVQGLVNDGRISGTAENVIAETEVKGLVFSNTLNQDGTRTLVVMGRTVIVTANTEYESEVSGVTLADLDSQTVVEVSGYSDNTGIVQATYLEVTANDGNAEEIKIKGLIAELDLPNNQFKLGDVIVIMDENTEFSDVAKEDLQNGLFVEVESESFDNSNVEPQIIASEIEVEEGNDDQEEGDEVEVVGLVVNIDNLGDGDSGEFELTDRVIRVNAETSYENGEKVDIELGVTLEVEGVVEEDGALLAKDIEFPQAEPSMDE